MSIWDFFKKKEAPAENSGGFVPTTVAPNNDNIDGNVGISGADGGASGGDGGSV